MSTPTRLKSAAERDFSALGAVGARIFIEDIYPSVDGGRFPVKRTVGDTLEVWSDIFREGHDELAAELRWRGQGDKTWHSVPMLPHGNDRWRASFTPKSAGRYFYAVKSWTNKFATWRRDYLLKQQAEDSVKGESLVARMLLDEARPLTPEVARIIEVAARTFDQSGDDAVLLSDRLALAMTETEAGADMSSSAIFSLTVERPLAQAGAWYELFPRSQGALNGSHGTFDDCIARVPEIAALGFDVLYLPPIHPIGHAHRKGKNNALTAQPDDPGSPYAIGNADGGHDAIDPQLGTLEDFRRLVDVCNDHQLEVALDFAVQCSPDHPWIKEHPDWFSWRPDGTLRYAENPPKKYQDIVNPDLYCADRVALWSALRDVILFWREQGVRIFRVDNPHTKAFAFWEWLIAEVQGHDPDIIFLSEAFTRPKLMKALAKVGFSQSYTYFTWRTTKAEISEYVSELTRYPEREYFRPNFFCNTPDILPLHLQGGEAWMFKSRVALAALLSSNYGIYSGFELLEHAALEGKEEYLDSEKYEIKPRDWNKPGNINDYIMRLNRIRRANPALLQTTDIRFLAVDNDSVIGFLKQSADHNNFIAAAVSLAEGLQEFWLHFGDIAIGHPGTAKPVLGLENLVTGERHRLEWGGVRLTINAAVDPAIVFRCMT